MTTSCVFQCLAAGFSSSLIILAYKQRTGVAFQGFLDYGGWAGRHVHIYRLGLKYLIIIFTLAVKPCVHGKGLKINTLF